MNWVLRLRKSPRAFALVLFWLLIARAGLAVLSETGIAWDFAGYYRVGLAIFEGRWEDLFRAHPLASYVGLPISAFLFAPLGAFSPRVALFVFKASCAVSFGAAIWVLHPAFRAAAARHIRPEWALPLHLAIWLLFAPVWFCFTMGGQATAHAVLMLALFHRFYVGGRAVAAAVVLSLAILLKPILALILPALLVALEVGLLVRTGLCLAAEGAASLAIFGWTRHVEWVQMVRSSAGDFIEPWWNNSAVWQVIQTMWVAARNGDYWNVATAPEPGAWFIAPLRAVMLIATIALLAAGRDARLDLEARRRYRAAMAISAALLSSGIVWPHYLAFLLVPLPLLLFPPGPLSKGPALSVWAMLISTLSVQSRPVQRYALAAFESAPMLHAAVAALFGSCTLLLLAVLVFRYHGALLRAHEERS